LSGKEKEVKIKKTDLTKPSKLEPMIQAVYAATCLLNQKTKTVMALETASSIGDKNFIDKLNNAFTNSEYGAVEDELREAMSNSKSRITEGYNAKYLPSADALCLLDVIELLMKDEDAYFYPTNPNFNYKRIGQSTM